MPDEPETGGGAGRASWLAPLVWSVVLGVVLLGPALGPGYVLSYDMVWVPDLAVRPDVWGLGSGLPRAVPSDAVVALLDEVVPGALLQKLVLLGALVAGGSGAARLVPGRSVAGGVVAASVYVWTPFVAERLLLGSWPVVVAYGLLPWTAVLATRWRRTGLLPVGLLVVVPLGSLSAGAGLATAVVLVAAAAGPRRTTWRAVGLAAAGNAPWLVAGVLHAVDATSAEVGARLFALQGHGSLPAPLEALALGGVWNSDVVPDSRGGAMAWVGLALLLALGLAVRSWWAALGRRDASALVVPWTVGMLLALLTWATPDGVGWLAAQVPGGGLLRDGSRWLLLCAPLVAALAGHAAGVVTRRVADDGARVVLAGAMALLPVMVLPDATFGLTGRLDAVDYPPDYETVREVVRDAGVEGDALVLPLSSYRLLGFADDRAVLDPTPRWLTVDTVASDVLVVAGTVVPGEDPRVEEVTDALAEPTPGTRSAALAAAGIGVVVTESGAPGPAPELAGEVLTDTGLLTVRLVEDVEPAGRPAPWLPALALAWLAYLGGPLAAPVLAWRRRGRPRGQRRGNAPAPGAG